VYQPILHKLDGKKTRQAVYDTCHGMYSLGGAVSAGIASVIALRCALPSGWQMFLLPITIALLSFYKKHCLHIRLLPFRLRN